MVGLTMKNFNIFGVHWKIQFLSRDSRKTNIEWEVTEKGDLGQFADLKVDFERKRCCFWGGGVDTLMHNMSKILM